MRALALLVAAVSAAALQSYPPAFPREDATKIFENERVVIWDVRWIKGKPSPMHEHRLPLARVFIRPGPVEVTLPDGSSRIAPPTVVSFQERGLVHMEEGQSDPPRHGFIIELKDHRPPPLAPKPGMPPTFPAEGAAKLLENDRVIIWDFRFDPAKPVPAHYHDKDSVVVTMASGKIRSTPPGGQPEIVTLTFGEARFRPRDRAHTEEVVEGSPRTVIVELK